MRGRKRDGFKRNGTQTTLICGVNLEKNCEAISPACKEENARLISFMYKNIAMIE